MTGLLVSVRNAREASAATRGGASIVDVKEPLHGSLGAASVEQWTEVVRNCQDQIPLSLALGELTDTALATRLAELPAVQFAKIGLAGCRQTNDWIPRWRWAVEQLPAMTSAVAVTYVDTLRAQAPDADEVRRQASQLGCCGMLWDTYDKSQGNLLDHLPLDQLAHQVAQVRQCGMMVVLAGSLTIDDLTQVQSLAPDFVAVRGAVCSGSRTGNIQSELVQQFAQAVNALNPL